MLLAVALAPARAEQEAKLLSSVIFRYDLPGISAAYALPDGTIRSVTAGMATPLVLAHL